VSREAKVLRRGAAVATAARLGEIVTICSGMGAGPPRDVAASQLLCVSGGDWYRLAVLGYAVALIIERLVVGVMSDQEVAVAEEI
jgi:hypothetical protein